VPRIVHAQVIAHVDMDAFFVAVELLRHPELRGRPVVVAHDGPRGVVTTASYEARKYGVHSALPMVTARRRCPQLAVLPVDMELYKRGSVKVMETLRDFSDTVEVVGLDEAYLDLSDSPVPRSRALEIKQRIKETTRLVSSIGLAPNRLMAKIASDLDKPDGLFVLDDESWLPTVGRSPASLLPGVGPRTFERLREAGIETVAELAAAEPPLLERAFGPKQGLALRERANGVGATTLTTERRPKSESRETTFATDVSDREQLATTLDGLARSVCGGLAKSGYRGRTVTMKIRLRPFRTHTRSRTLSSPTRDADEVAAVARQLLAEFELDAPVRLIGAGVAGLVADTPAAPSPEGYRDTTKAPAAQLRL
jgi:DNA polymerase-4